MTPWLRNGSTSAASMTAMGKPTPTANAGLRPLFQTLSMFPRPVPQRPRPLLGRRLPRRQDGPPQINKIIAVDSGGTGAFPSPKCNLLKIQDVPRCNAPNRRFSARLSPSMLHCSAKTKSEPGCITPTPFLFRARGRCKAPASVPNRRATQSAETRLVRRDSLRAAVFL